LALSKFNPLIAAQIVNLEPWQFNFFVGGVPEPVKASVHTCEVRLLRARGAMEIDYLMARIRLFGTLVTPVYFAVVGEL
jgi:hypothetical protein